MNSDCGRDKEGEEERMMRINWKAVGHPTTSMSLLPLWVNLAETLIIAILRTDPVEQDDRVGPFQRCLP
ncbi:hypothetical protein STEG23_021914, partial [Scotinomys teguina]